MTARQARVGALLLAAATSLSLAACGSDTLSTGGNGGASGTTSATPTVKAVTADPALAALVPAAIKSAGVLKVGSDASYAPNEFTDTDGKTVVGMDVDLFSAVAKKLGVKAEFQNADFGTIILGVTSGKFDVGVSSFTINQARLKQVNMVKYFSAGTLWAAAKGNPKKVDPDNACGLSIGVQQGTVQVDDLTARSKKCTDAGKPAINSVVEVAQSKVTTDLISGKVAAMAADSPVTNYAISKNTDAIESLGKTYDSAPYGVVVPKAQTQLADAVSKAFAALKADGTYDEITKKWGNEDGGVSDFAVNPSVSS